MANKKQLYRFTIKYYYCRYHTGNLNTAATRTAVVTATSRSEAIQKVVQVDDNAISIANLEFEEITTVEVVLCKDCKFVEACSIREAMACTSENGYCWRGERLNSDG